MSDQRIKAAASMSDMARMLHLSRARLYELIDEGVFPKPVYCIRTKRPFYNAELQAVCLRVRESGEGIDGRPILFYAPRRKATEQRSMSKRPGRSKPTKTTPKLQGLIDGLMQLGVSDASPSSIEAVVAELYPSGIESEQSESVLTAVFRRLSNRN